MLAVHINYYTVAALATPKMALVILLKLVELQMLHYSALKKKSEASTQMSRNVYFCPTLCCNVQSNIFKHP